MAINEIANYIFLGIIQGLTEFLPVSSSGHLVIAEKVINNFNPPGVFLETVLHLGTLAAVIVYFRKELINASKETLVLIAIGSVPAFAIGFFASEFIESLFTSLKAVGVALIITGVMNFVSDRLKNSQKNLNRKSALNIGLFQAFAIIPGISRSGSTIFGGLLQGVKRHESATFSFLLSIPAILAASGYQFVKYGAQVQSDLVPAYFFGFLAAFVVGFASIKVVFTSLVHTKFRYFGYYCIVLGIVTIIAS